MTTARPDYYSRFLAHARFAVQNSGAALVAEDARATAASYFDTLAIGDGVIAKHESLFVAHAQAAADAIIAARQWAADEQAA